jgi:hypothetical protein
MTKDDAIFWARHAETPGGVVLVDVYKNGDQHMTGIFSCWSKANDWVDEIDRNASDDCDLRAVFVPYVLDTPEMGFKSKKELS